MGSAADSPAPVGDPPTGTAKSSVVKGPSPLIQTAASVSAGESLDSTGGSLVPLKNGFPNTHSVICLKVEDDGGGRSDLKRTFGGSAYFAKYADSHSRLVLVGLSHVVRSQQL